MAFQEVRRSEELTGETRRSTVDGRVDLNKMSFNQQNTTTVLKESDRDFRGYVLIIAYVILVAILHKCCCETSKLSLIILINPFNENPLRESSGL